MLNRFSPTDSRFTHQPRHATILGCLAALLLFAICRPASPAAPASPWNFVPAPLEWAVWPVYCRVQWTKWTGGLDPESKLVYTAADQQSWQAAIGERTYVTLHHWCAAMIYLNRARSISDKTAKSFTLQQAWQDAEYTYQRADPSGVLFPNISATVAQVQIERGERAEAIETLQRAIEAQPTRPEPYATLAYAYRNAGDLKQARSTLVRANEVTGGKSAEIQYNLGLVALQMGDLDAATESAHEAYKLGYPLPWLRDRLKKLGRWRD